MLTLLLQRTTSSAPGLLSRVAWSRPFAPGAMLGVTRTFLSSAPWAEPAAKPKTTSTKKATTTKKSTTAKKPTTATAGKETKKTTAKKPAKGAVAKKPAAKAAEPKISLKEWKPPKRPVSAYLDFYLENFRQNPAKSMQEVNGLSTEISAKWKALSDSEKQPYVDRYHKRVAEYTLTREEYDKTVPPNVLRALKTQRRKVLDRRAKRAGPSIRPKLTPYIRFIKDFAPEFKRTFTGEPATFVRAMAKAGGERWHALPEHEKQVYKDAYEKERIELVAQAATAEAVHAQAV